METPIFEEFMFECRTQKALTQWPRWACMDRLRDGPSTEVKHLGLVRHACQLCYLRRRPGRCVTVKGWQQKCSRRLVLLSVQAKSSQPIGRLLFVLTILKILDTGQAAKVVHVDEGGLSEEGVYCVPFEKQWMLLSDCMMKHGLYAKTKTLKDAQFYVEKKRPCCPVCLSCRI